MKNAAVLVPVLLPVLAFAGLASAQRPTGDQMKTADRLAGEFVAAMRTGNVGWFRRAAAPEFVYTDIAGKRTNKKESIAQVAEGMKMMRIESFTRTIRSAKWTKEGIAFVAEYRMRAKMMGAKPSKPMTQSVRSETRAAWRGGRWVWVSVREI